VIGAGREGGAAAGASAAATGADSDRIIFCFFGLGMKIDLK
jgi:hypothetical protein